MNFLWLEYFVQVANEGNMSRAAEKNHVSLPCVSQIIQKLEREVGVPLFERQKNRILITEYGKRFLQYAKNTLTQRDDVLQEFHNTEGISGKITLCTSSVRAAYLAPSLWQLRLDYPGIEVILIDKDMPYEERIDTLRRGEADFIVAEERRLDADFIQVPLCLEYYYIVLSRESDMYQRHFPDGNIPEKISLKEFASEPILLSRAGTKIRQRIDKIFSDLGVSPSSTFTCSSLLVKEALTERGLGYMVKNYPEGFSYYLKRSDLCYIPIDHPQASLQLALIWRKGFYISYAQQLFIEAIKKCLSQNEDQQL